MVLKHWILPIDHIKTHLYFSIVGWVTLLSLDPDLKGVSKLKSFVESPSDKCRRTHIIQNSFHDAYFIFCLFFHFFSTKGGGGSDA